MLSVTLRGLRGRKLRTFLTGLAVVLGVAMISGTFIFTDTINKSFDNVFSTALAGVDVSVTPHETFSNTDPSPLPASILGRVKSAQGVKQAVGTLFSEGRIENKKGKLINNQGAPDFVASADPEPFNAFRYVQGRAPSAPGEVALDQHTVNDAGYHLGDTVRVSGQSAAKGFKLVGIARFGNAGSLAGASVAILTLAQAQQVLGKVGHFDAIDVQGDSGVSRDALAARVRAAVPPSATVRTGQQEASHDSKSIKDNLSFLTTLLLVFAGIALFVGAFMIFNAFSITVAQRMREFAILRMLGGSRRQVLSAVAGEAFLLGVGSSILGVAAGFGLAPALKALLKALGASLPTQGLVFQSRTIIVGLIVGIVVTMVASVGPAIRATRIPPIAALQDASQLAAGPRTRRWRAVVTAILVFVGVVLMALGLAGAASGGTAAALIGAGAAIIFVGVALFSSALVRPLASAVGRPLERLSAVAGRLARENSQRNPRRTASTAAALMVGVALVAFVTVFAAGLKHSIRRDIDRGVGGQLVVQGPLNSDQGLPLTTAAATAKVPQVTATAGLPFSQGRVASVGGTNAVTGAPPNLQGLYDVKWKSGGTNVFAGLGNGGVALKDTFAKKHDLHVGSRISVLTPNGKHLPFTVRGVFKDEGQFLGAIVVSRAVAIRDFAAKSDQVVIASIASGASVTAVKAALTRVLGAGFPGAKAYTKSEFENQQAKQVDGILALFYALLSLTVIVSLFGIVNTLVLTVYERTRELGMLRAIGASRRQIRKIVRYEAVITALIGAVIGVVLGTIFAVAVTAPLASQGFAISIPVVELVLLLVLAAVCGVLAAILPARRASRLNVLDALAYE